MALSALVERLVQLARSRSAPPPAAAPDNLLEEAVAAAASGAGGRARVICEDLLTRFPRYAAGHHLLGVLQAQNGDSQGALAHLVEAAALAPEWPDAHLALGNVRQLLQDAAGAEASYRRTLALDPAAAGAHYNLALLLRRAGRGDEALQALRRAHELAPERGDMTWDLVQALLTAGVPDEARAAAERTLALAGESADAHKSLGLVHLNLHEAAQALERFHRAAALAPADTEAWLHAGLAARELARLDDALTAYERVLSIAPDHAQARWHRSLVRLLKGEFDRAWTDYEARTLSETWPRRGFPQPRWRGEPLAGKTLLVHSEQGLGDEIMFASCLPEVIAQARHCVIDCHPRLAPIFERSFPSATVHGGHQTDDPAWLARHPAPDYQIPIGSLPLFLRARPGDFSRHAGYLAAHPAKVASWRARLAGLGPGLKVGLSWQGGTQLSRSRLRSLTLEQLLPVLRVEGARFVDLQYTETARERAHLESEHGVRLTHWPDAIADYDETAALASAVDLVVTVCTALVHLTGALGRPAWVMTPYSPEWRYGQAGDGMLWYPSVKLLRQPRYGEWEPVIATVARDLRLAAGARSG